MNPTSNHLNFLIRHLLRLRAVFLYAMYGERYLNEMTEIKRAFDPNGIVGRGNVFDAKFLQ